jgi:hypothetical protein
MFFTRAARQLTIRIALLAMLMAALFPSISHTMRAGAAGAWVEVCTALGAKWVAADSSTTTDDPAPTTAHGSQDCPYCSLQAHSPALPPASAIGLPATALQFAVPRLFFLAPRTPHAWAAAQARAPPRTA